MLAKIDRWATCFLYPLSPNATLIKEQYENLEREGRYFVLMWISFFERERYSKASTNYLAVCHLRFEFSKLHIDFSIVEKVN